MKITIRPLEENDAYTSWHWRNDPEVFANTVRRYSGPVTLEDELNWIRTVLARPDERRFAILADGKYIGNVNLTDISSSDATIGIFIGDKSYWRKNIGTEAYTQVFDHIITSLNLSTLNCPIRIQNLASIRLHKKLGFSIINRDAEFVYCKKKLTV